MIFPKTFPPIGTVLYNGSNIKIKILSELSNHPYISSDYSFTGSVVWSNTDYPNQKGMVVTCGWEENNTFWSLDKPLCCNYPTEEP